MSENVGKSRRFHTDSLSSEYFTEDGLKQKTSENPRNWGRYVVKESMDNALEAHEDSDVDVTPVIEVDLLAHTFESSYSRRVVCIMVRDNGPGMAEDRLSKIFGDTEHFGGTKRHYALPTRGNQGNALMTLLGIQHLCGGPLTVVSGGRESEIAVTETYRGREIEITTTRVSQAQTSLAPASADGQGPDGFGVTVEFMNQALRYGPFDQTVTTVREFIALNPQADITFRIYDTDDSVDDHVERSPATEPTTAERHTLAKAANSGEIPWFGLDGFKARLNADMRADSALTIDEFVSEFSGLSSRPKRKAVLDGFGEGDHSTKPTISNLFDSNEQLKSDLAADLYHRMVAETTLSKASGLHKSIGSVGKDLRQGAIHHAETLGDDDQDGTGPQSIIDRLTDDETNDIDSIDDLTCYYADGAVVTPDEGVKNSDEKTVPFYFEIAVVPYAFVPEGTQASTEVVFGINKSVAYSEPHFSPLLSISHLNTSQRHSTISSAFKTIDHGFVVVCNLTCPNIGFNGRGKQEFDTEPFTQGIEETVSRAVKKAERHVRPKLNGLRSAPEPEAKLEGKCPHGFIKEFIFETFDDAFEWGSQGGTLPLFKRQHYYTTRDWFLEECERRGYKWTSRSTPEDPTPVQLVYGTYESHIDDYETEVLGERVLERADRGFFIEPHSDKRVKLGTQGVRNYTPNLEQYGSLLFLEKTGFSDMIHDHFELTKQWDVAPVQGQGYSTIASRDLVEEIQSLDGDVRMYAVTDLDIDGLGIAADAKNPDELSAIDVLDVERIGIEPSDVREYDLRPESADYKDNELKKLNTHYEAGNVDKETYEFLTSNGGQRVEINALAPPVLRQFLIDKFDELGVEKVAPEDHDNDPEIAEVEAPDDIRDEQIRETIGDWVLEQTRNDLTEHIEEQADSEVDADLVDKLEGLSPDEEDARTNMTERINEELANYPPKSWQDINGELVDEDANEIEEVSDEYSEVVDGVVRGLLAENVTVELTFNGQKR